MQIFTRLPVGGSASVAIAAAAYASLLFRAPARIQAFSPAPTAIRHQSRRPFRSRLVRCGMASSSSFMQDEQQDQEHEAPQHVLIAGAGVIGLSTAYFLAKNHGDHLQSITIIDPTGSVAPAASGKAGGFLARDWNDHSYTEELTHRSFHLHQELANDLGASTIDYRRLSCAAIRVSGSGSAFFQRPKGEKLQGVEWAQPSQLENSAVLGMRPLGDETTIAQVHPKKLCERLWQAVCDKVPTAKLVQGTIKGAVHSPETGRLVGALLADDHKNNENEKYNIDGTVVSGDALLYACGPWTADIVQGVKYHSVVVPTEKVLTQCVFFSGCGDPEVYVRPDSTAYCTGFPESDRIVTERPGEEEVLPEKIETILQSVRTACGQTQKDDGNDRPSLQTKTPMVEQACYLPTTRDGVPVMGALPEDVAFAGGGGHGCYIATGHTCWGILLGPASGESMASLIMTGRGTPHVNLDPFQPTLARFHTFQMVPSSR